MVLTVCTTLLLSVWIADRPETVTVPNLGVYLPTSSSVRDAFGSTWTTVGLRNRPDWSRRDVVYSPDVRLISAPARAGDGTRLVLLPALWRATLQLAKPNHQVKYAIFAEAGMLGAFTSTPKSRFTAVPATGIGFSVIRDRVDMEAQYLQPMNMDGRDFTGFALGFGYRL
jgi:hypothetical protein